MSSNSEPSETRDATSGVVDLRQYTLVPGGRDRLIDLFDTYFVAGQENVGVHIIGQFRDLDDPNRFVWLREFDSMPARAEALARFYYGPVWQAHRDEANATMADSDDALLLEPVHVGTSCPSRNGRRVAGPAWSLVAITVIYLDDAITAHDRELSEIVRTEFERTGGEVVATFVTHAAENNFAPLPLRDENVLVWVTRFADDASHARHRELLTASPAWNDVLADVGARTRLPMQQLRLRPTHGSRLR